MTQNGLGILINLKVEYQLEVKRHFIYLHYFLSEW